MKFIAHRGNVCGKNIDKENSIDYISYAIDIGYDVEIDVWYEKENFWLGHDHPQYLIDYKFLLNIKLWCHAKNLEALNRLNLIGAHCFWHENDTFTLTSKNIIWSYPGSDLCSNSVCVLPEFNNQKLKINNCYGICSDFILKYKNEYSNLV